MPGETADEVLVSAYVLPPVALQRQPLGRRPDGCARQYSAAVRLRYSYRFLFGPGTIGPLSWLWKNEDELERIGHGLVLSCVGRPGPLTYKQSRRGDAEIDQAAANVLRAAGGTVIPLRPWGDDERQFCSPGFNLPVGALTQDASRTVPGLPQLGRRPRARAAGVPGRLVSTLPRDRRRAGDEPALP